MRTLAKTKGYLEGGLDSEALSKKQREHLTKIHTSLKSLQTIWEDEPAFQISNDFSDQTKIMERSIKGYSRMILTTKYTLEELLDDLNKPVDEKNYKNKYYEEALKDFKEEIQLTLKHVNDQLEDSSDSSTEEKKKIHSELNLKKIYRDNFTDKYPEYLKTIIQQGGKFIPVSQDLDPFVGETGMCYGLARVYARQVSNYGKCQNIPTVNQEVYNFQTHQSRLDPKIWMSKYNSLSKYKKIIRQIVNEITDKMVYELNMSFLVNKNLGHTATIRKIPNTDYYEFYDSKKFLTVFPNKEILINCLAQYLYEGYSSRVITRFALFKMSDQPSNATASIKLNGHSSTSIPIKQDLTTKLENPLRENKYLTIDPERSILETSTLSYQNLQIISNIIEKEDKSFDHKELSASLQENYNQKYQWLKEFCLSNISKNELSEIKYSKISPMNPDYHQLLKTKVYEEIEVEKNRITGFLFSNPMVKNRVQLLEDLKENIKNAPVHLTLVTVIESWLEKEDKTIGKTYQDIIAINRFGSGETKTTGFIDRLLTDYEISPYRVLALQELVLKKIIMILFKRDWAPICQSGEDKKLEMLKKIICSSFESNIPFGITLQEIIRKFESRSFGGLFEKNNRSSDFSEFSSILSTISDVDKPEKLCYGYQLLENFCIKVLDKLPRKENSSLTPALTKLKPSFQMQY